MIKVIFDSNFFFVPTQFKLDVFEELANLLGQRLDSVLLSTTLEELLEIAEKGPPKTRRQASLALKLAQECLLVQVEKTFKETNDDVIVRVATKWRCPVATNDRDLKKRLRSVGIPVIFLRQRSRLDVEGAL